MQTFRPKRQIDTDKFVTDESKSNPLVVALHDPDCPLGDGSVCGRMVVGFGTWQTDCEHLSFDGDKAMCGGRREE